MSTPRPPGRPRSEAARRAILDASLSELTTHGYADLTVEGIAARAGVGKQTIYRWWTGKAEVVLDAMLDTATALVRVPDTGSFAADLDGFLRATFRQRSHRPALVGLMAQALLDPAFADLFKERFLLQRREALRILVRRARARGELADDVDEELLLDVVFGVLWYRLLLQHQPLDARTGARLATMLQSGVLP